MATLTNSSAPRDRATLLPSDNPTIATQAHRVSPPTNTNSAPLRPSQYLDDADILAWKRQHATAGAKDLNTMSNSAKDMSHLDDRLPYQFDVLEQDYHDMDDGEIHFDNGTSYDYDSAIHERLKRANEEFQHDQTPAELKHRQRVSFDAIVKAVDIVQDPADHTAIEPVPEATISPSAEVHSTKATVDSKTDTNPHQYTVPLNDTQPKEGPTLLEQLKAMQFHGAMPVGERWSSVPSHSTNEPTVRKENSPPSKPTVPHSDKPTHTEEAAKRSSSPQQSMVVAINGSFELQHEDDYTVKHTVEGHDDHDSRKKSASRPKSSDPSKRSVNISSATAKPSSDSRGKADTSRLARSKSAIGSKPAGTFEQKSFSGVDNDELNRRAAEKKRLELQEKNRKEEAKKQQEIKQIKAKESFERWARDYDAATKKRLDERKIEEQEQESRELEKAKALEELRKKKLKEWNDRVERDKAMTNELKKLEAEEKAEADGSTSSMDQGHRAFHRWLRLKYEQSKEEKRQMRLEERRLRRRQHRSMKRFRLYRDLQLAKSFGYS